MRLGVSPLGDGPRAAGHSGEPEYAVVYWAMRRRRADCCELRAALAARARQEYHTRINATGQTRAEHAHRLPRVVAGTAHAMAETINNPFPTGLRRTSGLQLADPVRGLRLACLPEPLQRAEVRLRGATRRLRRTASARKERRLVSQIFTSWNPLMNWMRSVDLLRRVA